MKKKQLIDAIVEQAGERAVTKKQAETVLLCLAHLLDKSLSAGDEMNLPGVGKFSVKTKPARVARNPRTGESVNVPESVSVKFSASSTLKNSLNNK